MVGDKKHYSYAVYAEKATAENFERERFSGPIGSLLRERQEAQLKEWLGDPRGLSILDVGAGTGRTAIPLAASGARVAAYDASEAMLDVAKRNAVAAGVEIEFTLGDAMSLPYADRSFDAVLCFRLLLHVVDWRLALAEACRCTRNTLILDFPPRCALAALQMPFRALAALFRPRTQRFKLFSLGQIKREIRRLGFVIEKVDKLWFLPIAFHKLFGSGAFTLGVERFLGWLGLRRLFGAPATLLARRETSEGRG